MNYNYFNINISDAYRIGFFDGFNSNAPNACTSNMTREEYYAYCDGMNVGAKILDTEITSVETRNESLRFALDSARSNIDCLRSELDKSKLAHADTIKRNEFLYEELCLYEELRLIRQCQSSVNKYTTPQFTEMTIILDNVDSRGEVE